VSVAVHVLVASLTFGGTGAGLPGLDWPWRERRVEVPDLRLRLELPPQPALPEQGRAAALAVAQPAPPSPRATATAATAELAPPRQGIERPDAA
jgi:hypothetical protein